MPAQETNPEYEAVSAKATFYDTPDNMARIDEQAELSDATRSAVIRTLVKEALDARQSRDLSDF